ncbi:MAG: hypothetical protein LUG98_16670 [Tannerellaceae bacterium]|nr:hypothetical protein [Tannerellaceae bacterium]
MKKLILLYAVLSLSGCHQIPSFNETTGTHEVCLLLELSASIHPFPQSKSIPGFPPEPGSSGSESPSFSFEYIYYVIADANTNEIIEENQIWKNDNTDDFGSYLYVSLPAGSYRICIITHSSHEATLEEELFIMKDPSDTFCGITSFEIENQKKEIPVTLTRRVSRIEFVPTDEIPEEVEEFCMYIPHQYQTIHVLTGESATNSQGYMYTYTFSEEDKTDGQIITHAFYTLVPEAIQNKLSYVELIVKGKEDEVLYSRKVSDIPVHANRITRYSGLLYSSGMGDGTFDLDFEDGGNWSGTDEYPLP